MSDSIDTNAILDHIAIYFGGALLIAVIAVVAFSYLVSRGKKRTGVVIGSLILLAAVCWLLVMPI